MAHSCYENSHAYERSRACEQTNKLITADVTAGRCAIRSAARRNGPGTAKVAAENFALIRGAIKVFEKTPGIKRGFCGECGTTLTYAAEHAVEGQDWQADAWFTAASLDDPSIARPKTHVYVSNQQPWIKLADGLPTFPEF